MKINTTTIESSDKLATMEIMFFLEMGNIAGTKGNDQEAIDWYVKGLQLAKHTGDNARAQQFSNLILTYL